MSHKKLYLIVRVWRGLNQQWRSTRTVSGVDCSAQRKPRFAACGRSRIGRNRAGWRAVRSVRTSVLPDSTRTSKSACNGGVARPTRAPGFDLGMFIRGIVVHDQVIACHFGVQHYQVAHVGRRLHGLGWTRTCSRSWRMRPWKNPLSGKPASRQTCCACQWRLSGLKISRLISRRGLTACRRLLRRGSATSQARHPRASVDVGRVWGCHRLVSGLRN